MPIEPGENVVRVWTWNADGPCREPGTLAGLVYQAAPPPKPEVAILDPGSDGPVHTPSIAVEFRVRSSSPLKKVELVRVLSDREQPVLFAADIAEARRNAKGGFELRATTTVALNPSTTYCKSWRSTPGESRPRR